VRLVNWLNIIRFILLFFSVSEAQAEDFAVSILHDKSGTLSISNVQELNFQAIDG